MVWRLISSHLGTLPNWVEWNLFWAVTPLNDPLTWGKVMFSQVSVCPQGEADRVGRGRGWGLPRSAQGTLLPQPDQGYPPPSPSLLSHPPDRTRAATWCGTSCAHAGLSCSLNMKWCDHRLYPVMDPRYEPTRTGTTLYFAIFRRV